MRSIEHVTKQMAQDRDEFLKLVCDEMEVSALCVMSRKRDRRTSMARHLVMWALHKYSYATSTQIGAILGRDHASVLYGIGAVETVSKMPYGGEIRKIMELIKAKGEAQV